MEESHRLALEWALRYRRLGLVPLPSRTDRKAPDLANYKQYRYTTVKECEYSENRWRSPNVQLMTGVLTSGKTKILVVDIDGPEARKAWKSLCAQYTYTPTGVWICETGRCGIHVYFKISEISARCESRIIWLPEDLEERGSRHEEIRILGDCTLAVAPPSCHVITGKTYRWYWKWNPDQFPTPEEAPAWLLALPGIEVRVKKTDIDRKIRELGLKVIRPPERPPEACSMTGRDDLLAAIAPGQKLYIAMTWGLRLTGAQNGDWAECRSIDREDKRPSASLNLVTGVYHDFASKRSLSFYDLGVALGAFPNFKEALNTLSSFANLNS